RHVADVRQAPGVATLEQERARAHREREATAGAQADVDVLPLERAIRERGVFAVDVAAGAGVLTADVEGELRTADDVRRERRAVRQWQVQQDRNGDVLNLDRLVLTAITAIELGALRDREDLRLNADPAEAETDEPTAY